MALSRFLKEQSADCWFRGSLDTTALRDGAMVSKQVWRLDCRRACGIQWQHLRVAQSHTYNACRVTIKDPHI